MDIEKVLKQAVKEYKEFAYDGCHKIYIIENEEYQGSYETDEYSIDKIKEIIDKEIEP